VHSLTRFVAPSPPPPAPLARNRLASGQPGAKARSQAKQVSLIDFDDDDAFSAPASGTPGLAVGGTASPPATTNPLDDLASLSLGGAPAAAPSGSNSLFDLGAAFGAPASAPAPAPAPASASTSTSTSRPAQVGGGSFFSNPAYGNGGGSSSFGGGGAASGMGGAARTASPFGGGSGGLGSISLGSPMSAAGAAAIGRSASGAGAYGVGASPPLPPVPPKQQAPPKQDAFADLLGDF